MPGVGVGGRRPHRPLVTLAFVTLVVGTMVLASYAAFARGPMAKPTNPAHGRIVQFTTFNTWYSNWGSQSVSTPSGCYAYNSPAGPTLSFATSTGVVSGTGDIQVSKGTGCPSTVTYSWNIWAGAHSVNTWGPTTTGLYKMTADWTLTVKASVIVTCGSSVNDGVSLAQYASVDIIPYMALYNTVLGEGWTLPNNMQNVFHLDSRDGKCAAQSPFGDPNAIVLVQNLYSVTVDTVSEVYGSSAYNYAPRAALEFNLYTTTQSSEVADASYTPQVSADATLNSITIS